MQSAAARKPSGAQGGAPRDVLNAKAASVGILAISRTQTSSCSSGVCGAPAP